MNQKKQLFKNTIIIAIGKLSTQIISFLLLPLYTSKLAPSEYGTYDFLVTLSVFLLPVITLLMEESMFRFLIDAEDKKSRKKVITQTVAYTIFGTIIFSIITGIVVSVIHYEYGFVFIIFVISNIMIGLSNALARGMGEVKLYSLSNFILGASTILLNIFFIVVLKLGAAGLLWANTIANAATAIIMFGKLRLSKYVSKKSMNRKLMNEMIHYSIPLVPNSLSWAIINLSDRLIIISFLGDSANGIYSIANRFPNILNTFYGFFYTAWKESAARILKEENKKQYYNNIYRDMKKFLFAIVLCLIAVMPFAFPILINEEYQEAYQYIPALILSIYYSNISSFYGGIFSAYKNTKIMGNTTMVAAVLNIIINVVFIKLIGIHAAVLSTVVSNLIVYLYRRKALRRYIKLRERVSLTAWTLFIAVVICYYTNNKILQAVALLLAIIYSIYSNRKFIKSILGSILAKLKR